MRAPLPFLAIAFSLGILVEDLCHPAWLLAASASVLLALAAFRRSRWAPLLALLAALATGAGASGWTRGQAATPPAGEFETTVDGIVDGAVERHGEAQQAVVEIGDTLVLARWREPVTVWPGDQVRLHGRVQRPAGYQDEGAFDRARFLAGRGITLRFLVRAPGPVVIRRGGASPWRWAAVLQDRLAARLPATGDGRALLASLVLGDRGSVPPTLEDGFRRLGVAHVLSVSGLHLAAVVLVLFWLLRWLVLRAPWDWPAERVAALAAAPLAVAYALMTGAATATLRAMFAALVVLGAVALGRRVHAPSVLALAALALLLPSPWVLYEPSFQLSFAAAAALVLCAPWLRRAGAVLRLVGSGAWVFVVTAPLSALHFGQLLPAGILANLVVVPLAELVIVPLGLAGVLVGGPVLWLAALAARLLAWLVRAAAPYAPVLEVSPPSGLELVLIYGALAALVWLRPWRRALVVSGGLAFLLVGSCLARGWLAPSLRRTTQVVFLDVGQGDSAVIFAPGGQTWLVDAGGRLFEDPAESDDDRLRARLSDPGEQAVWRFLAARRVRRLDLVIISHAHPDHMGGLLALAEHLPIGEVWVSGDDGGDPRLGPLLDRLARAGTRVQVPPLGVARWAGDARLVVLGPGVPTHPGENDDSLVVRLEAGGHRVLFAGDLEARGEADLVASGADLRADVIKVPHHGSRTSSTPALVAAVQPGWAVISAGAGNRFGFPHPQVVERWAAAGARVLCTAQTGAITVDLASGPLSPQPFVAPADNPSHALPGAPLPDRLRVDPQGGLAPGGRSDREGRPGPGGR